ncbi:MAG: bifunctional nicotinamidase/pyrazinamidase [Thermodesulfobacteriota bacterium]
MAKEATKTGVIVVDVQGDFTKLKNGSLAVDGTDEAYVKAVEESTRKLKEAGYPIYATQDWHPKDHASFFTKHKGQKAFDVIKLHGKDQVLWPSHCVQKTPGAEILLDNKLFTAVTKKGMDPQYDSYSGFQDDDGKKTVLNHLLKKDGIRKLVVYGIATDYCVRATALDGVAAGYEVVLIKNLCRGVAPDTSEKAIEEMRAKGIAILEKIGTHPI